MISIPDTVLAQNRTTLKIHQCPFLGNSFWQRNLNFGFPRCYFGQLMVARGEMNIEKLEGKEEEKPRFRWVKIGPDITEDQKRAISQISPKLSNRCKAFIKQIICFSPEKGSLLELLAAWVKSMKPARADWLLVLKEMSRLEHPLYVEVHIATFLSCRCLFIFFFSVDVVTLSCFSLPLLFFFFVINSSFF